MNALNKAAGLIAGVSGAPVTAAHQKTSSAVLSCTEIEVWSSAPLVLYTVPAAPAARRCR